MAYNPNLPILPHNYPFVVSFYFHSLFTCSFYREKVSSVCARAHQEDEGGRYLSNFTNTWRWTSQAGIWSLAVSCSFEGAVATSKLGRHGPLQILHLGHEGTPIL